MNTGQLLRECAKTIAEPGAWTQRTWENSEQTAWCACGILSKVSLDDDGPLIPVEAVSYFSRIIEKPSKTMAIMDWNDKPNRTQRDVIRAFIRAADLWEKENENELG